jgi:hypothetical protein
MMISCQDAPTLENALHKALHKSRINKVNPRKEFFRSDISTILEVVRSHHGDVDYVAEASAFEYRESLTINDEVADFVEKVFDEAEQSTAQVVED